MVDEATSAAPSAPESAPASTPAPAQDEPVNLEAPRQDTSAESQTESDELQPDDDEDEYELDGRKFRAPKTLKERMLMHADYTRKTQEAAAFRRELEQQREAVVQQAQQSEEEVQARGQLWAISTELERYQNVDWAAWEQTDPMAAQSGWRQYQELKDKANSTDQYLKGKAQERTQSVQRETAQRIEQTREWAQKNIKGWSPDVDAKVTDFATRELGFTPNNLREAINPQVYRAIHLAWIGHQAISKPVQKPTPAAPLQTVQARTAPSGHKSLADMDMNEYAAYRSKQMAARGR